MIKSQRLTLADVRRVFSLLGEVREVGGVPSVWRRHLLEGLCAQVDADIAHAAEASASCSATKPCFKGLVITGVTGWRELAIYDALVNQRDYSDDPCSPKMANLIRTSFTCVRQQLADDHLWYRRRDLDAWRALGADQFIYSHELLPELGCLHLVALNRAWGRRGFTERERRILALCHAELGRLWRSAVAFEADLPPRLRQTLFLLLEGAAEKEIAAALQLSTHTAHDYVKTIYRRFGVNSHAKLLAQWARSPRPRAPVLESVPLENARGGTKRTRG